ncbi:hypothetical protein BT96DRAFT_835372 [Gymnopus androsaceus JB14]|uniref:DUF7702 domain-containing protein n=1 Tax=Gymnopus androsaceus JB14 TaxID=1447944 RepID=A0A6A4GVN4_9AGAR|nr:hypothetical protein BT96DRAFT_835372 [Gymnopus androsaceus JB14]
MASAINFAKAFGFDSVAAAAVFAVLYSLFAGYFVFKIIKDRGRVLISLTLFCLIRVAAFVMRAISAGNSGAGENESLFIATEVLLSIGFFGLLYSAYSLVMDRCLHPNSQLPIPILGQALHLTRNRRLFRMTLLVPVALGIAGIDETSQDSSSTTGIALRKASVIIFLVLTILQVLHTLVLIKAEHEDPSQSLPSSSLSLRSTHTSLLFGLISLFLLIREIFTVATISNLAKANNEHFWYPLVALPELLCVVLFVGIFLGSSGMQAQKGVEENDVENGISM